MFSAPLLVLFRVLVVIVSSAAGLIDLRTRRIPNWLAAAGLAAGFAARYYAEGAPGLLTAGKGLGLAVVIYFPLWLLRGMGAGDVKLMAALGAIAGPAHWFLIFLASSILGAVAALFVAFRYGRVASTLLTTLYLAKELMMFRAPWRSLPQTDYRHKEALRIPHGTIIAAAVIVLAIFRLL
jgi:prepilin peptidase CpaA